MNADTIHRRRWMTLGVLCVSLLVVSLDNTILNVALPTLVEDLHATASQQQWLVDAYTLVFASLLLTGGALGDKFGRRGALMIGLGIFGTGSLLAAFTSSAWSLIGTRAAMGIGGALIMPATLSILTNTFTDPKERTKAIGIWAGVSGLGVAIGPILGGWLLHHFWWGSVFLVNVPVVIAGIALGYLLIAPTKETDAPRLDIVGTVLSFVGLASMIYGIIEAPSKGWVSGSILAAFALAIVMLGSFVYWELHTQYPVLDVRLFRNPRFSGASVAISLTFFALFGSIFFVTQYLQFVLGYDALAAGIRTAPVALAIVLGAAVSAPLTNRLGSKIVVTAGLASVGVGLFVLSLAKVDSGYGIVFATLIILGFGMGMAMTPATDSIMGAVPPEKAGVGSAVNDTTRELGGVLGVAILGSIAANSYHSNMPETALANRGLPQAAASAAHDSIGGAISVARSIGAAGQDLARTAGQHYVTAMSTSVRIGAGFAVLGALVALIWLPARAAAARSERVGFDAETAMAGLAEDDAMEMVGEG